MQEQINAAIELLKKQDIQGCITGSCLLDYFPGQDIDVFVYSETDLNKILFYMKYNPLFQILDPLEKYKFDEYINKGKSSLYKIGLITIKFKYNLSVDVNIVFRKTNNNIFDVISNFDISLICKGYDIKTGKTLDLSDYNNDKVGTWNCWNKSFYNPDMWDCKRFMRQFERVIKYEQRGYNLESVTDKYIELVDQMLELEDIYKTEKGHEFYTKTRKEFELISAILKEYKRSKVISPEALMTLKTII